MPRTSLLAPSKPPQEAKDPPPKKESKPKEQKEQKPKKARAKKAAAGKENDPKPLNIKRKANGEPGEQPASKKSRAKKVKDPNAPKQPATAYLLFSNAHRAALVAEKPELKFNEIGKYLGSMWKDLPDDQKKEFQGQADEARKKYLIELEKYNASRPAPQPCENGEQEPVKKPKAPPPFRFFSNQKTKELRESQPALTPADLRKMVKDCWDALPEQEKQPYKDQSAKARTALKEAGGPVGGAKRAKKPKDPNAPKKPLSAYFMYCASRRKNSPEKTLTTKELSEDWRATTEEDKKPFNDAAAAEKSEYDKKLALYKSTLVPSAAAPESAGEMAQSDQNGVGGGEGLRCGAEMQARAVVNEQAAVIGENGQSEKGSMGGGQELRCGTEKTGVEQMEQAGAAQMDEKGDDQEDEQQEGNEQEDEGEEQQEEEEQPGDGAAVEEQPEEQEEHEDVIQ